MKRGHAERRVGVDVEGSAGRAARGRGGRGVGFVDKAGVTAQNKYRLVYSAVVPGWRNWQTR